MCQKQPKVLLLTFRCCMNEGILTGIIACI